MEILATRLCTILKYNDFPLIKKPLQYGAYRASCPSLSQNRTYLTETQVASAIKPIYTKVHPDLFGQYPKARLVNETSLKQLRSHLDTMIEKRRTQNTTLQFFVRDDQGNLEQLLIDLKQKELKPALQSILKSFKLPLAPLSTMIEQSASDPTPDRPIVFHDTSKFHEEDEPKRILRLYDWLIKNMWVAESRLTASDPIRRDITRLKHLLKHKIGVRNLSSDRGTATIRFRGCLLGLMELYKEYPDIEHMLRGRVVHFGNVTGVNLKGDAVLGISEVRSQWLSFIQRLSDVDTFLSRIPGMQKAVSICLRDIQVAHRKFGGSVVARSYGHDLRRLVTSLGDHRGSHGLPQHWPDSLEHLQLVVEPPWGPMTLSPTGQLIVPSSCPPPHLIGLISDKLEEAPLLLAQYEKLKIEEKTLYNHTKSVFKFEMLEKDDSVTPTQMIQSLTRLLENADRLSPLLSGSRIWITRYYAVMHDGEICIPWDWDVEE